MNTKHQEINALAVRIAALYAAAELAPVDAPLLGLLDELGSHAADIAAMTAPRVVKYSVSGYVAFSERDVWATGCEMEGGKNEYLSGSEWKAVGDTLDELIATLCAEFAASPDCVMLDACDELGRIDIQVNQRVPFNCQRPTQKSIDDWKAGKGDMWLTNYTFHIDRIEHEFALSAHVADAAIYASN